MTAMTTDAITAFAIGARIMPEFLGASGPKFN